LLETVEDLWEIEAGLLWHQHGGSGFSLTRADIGEMLWPELLWWAEKANANRSKEAAALKRAGSKK
jgi:hypothetical protein